MHQLHKNIWPTSYRKGFHTSNIKIIQSYKVVLSINIHAVDIEIPFPDNPDWKSFKFVSESMHVMDDDAWT